MGSSVLCDGRVAFNCIIWEEVNYKNWMRHRLAGRNFDGDPWSGGCILGQGWHRAHRADASSTQTNGRVQTNLTAATKQTDGWWPLHAKDGHPSAHYTA